MNVLPGWAVLDSGAAKSLAGADPYGNVGSGL